MLPGTARLEETAFRGWKGLHLVYLLSWKFWVWLRGRPGSEPGGKIWEKADTQAGTEQGGKQLPWQSPQGDAKSPVLCQGRVRRPCELGWRGQPMSLLQVAVLDEHAGDLLNVVLDMEGPTNMPFIHSFCKQSWRAFCARDTARHRDDKHSLPAIRHKDSPEKILCCSGKPNQSCHGGRRGDLPQSSPHMCPLQGPAINFCNHCLKSHEITPCSEELLHYTSWAHRICARCSSPRFRNSLSLKGKGCMPAALCPLSQGDLHFKGDYHLSSRAASLGLSRKGQMCLWAEESLPRNTDVTLGRQAAWPGFWLFWNWKGIGNHLARGGKKKACGQQPPEPSFLLSSSWAGLPKLPASMDLFSAKLSGLGEYVCVFTA